MTKHPNSNFAGLKVMLLLLAYLAVCTTHLFFVKKVVHEKKHNYYSIFKGKSENALNLQQAYKSTVNEYSKSSKGIIKNIKLFYTVLLFKTASPNLSSELSPPYNQRASGHYLNHLDWCIIRV